MTTKTELRVKRDGRTWGVYTKGGLKLEGGFFSKDKAYDAMAALVNDGSGFFTDKAAS